MRSSSRILNLRGSNHFFPEIAAEVGRGSKVNGLPSKDGRQFALHRGHGDEAWFLARIKLHDKVNIAFLSGVAGRAGSRTARAA